MSDARAVHPLAAFDIVDGASKPVHDPWPNLGATEGYRWLHFDLKRDGFEGWTDQHVPPIAARALRQTETRPRCERLGDGLILNLRGVNLNPESDPEDMVSLRMWITEDAIVSARVRKVWAVDAIKQLADTGTAPASIGRFLADLTLGLTTRIETISLGLEDETDGMEETVLSNGHIDPARLSNLRQAVIKMRRFINPQREAIAILAAQDDWIIGDDDLALLREVSNRTRRVVEELDATRDRLTALHDHMDARGAHALSRNSYVLSVVAAIFLPLGFLTGLFGVNLGGMPGVSSSIAFWVLTAGSAVCGVALYLIFKFSKWL